MFCNRIACIGLNRFRSLSFIQGVSSTTLLLPAASRVLYPQPAGAHRSNYSEITSLGLARDYTAGLNPATGCMGASALPGYPSLLLSSSRIPRYNGLMQRRGALHGAFAGLFERNACSSFHSSSKQQEQHQQEQQHSSRRNTTAHAAASSATWDHPHDHHDQHNHSSSDGHSGSEQKQTNSCGCSHTHKHSHGHGHHHHHGHGHTHGHSHGHTHGHHHHHYHTDASASSNPVLSALSKTGLFSLSEHLERHTAYTVTSVSCFVAALLMPFCVSQGLLQAATAAMLGKAALAVTYMLSGIPQLAETIGAAVAGKIDTHVLMSLSVVGTLYMGMAQEGALLLLLFRVSHLLEDRLTEKAAGSLQRLFDSVPDSASVVEVDETGAPRVATTQQVPAESVLIGQHVLVRPGEQVPLDGTITWGTANLSLQHISGEAQPVKLGPGQEVPAGSLSTDGLLVIRAEATAENSTPSRIAQMAADAQAQRPQLTRWLDGVGEVWSKAVIGATIATAALLPLLGVPFLGDRGALYRAMGVLTAGSPCALALVPLAYACAIAAITSKGMLIKSGAALDALAACKTIALDKTGTITTGSLNLAEGFVLNLKPGESAAAAAYGNGSSSSSSSSRPGWISVRAMEGLTELCKKVAAGGSSAAIGQTTHYSSSSFESCSDEDDYEHKPHGAAAATLGTAAGQPVVAFDELALKCAVALSRLSNHPVSRAMVESAPHVDGDVAVLSFEQVPGSGVQGVCKVGDAEPVHVRFGAADWINSYMADANTVTELNGVLKQHTNRPSRATVVLTISQLLPVEVAAEQHQQPSAPEPDTAVILEGSSSSSSQGALADSSSSSRPSSPYSGSRSSSRIGSRPVSPSKFIGTHENRDGTTTFSFDYEDLMDGNGSAAAAAASPAEAAHHQQQYTGISSSAQTSDDHQQQQQQQVLSQHPHTAAAAAAAGGSSSPSSSISGSADVDGAYGPPGQPEQLALLCFEDVIQPGVPKAVQQLQSGKWSRGIWRGTGNWLLGGDVAAVQKDVVMLTGDNQRVAQAVANAVGIQDYRAGLKPEDKLSYVQQAAAVATAAGRKPGSGANGLLMAGDGINDAPALAAAQVGVAIASTPKDMVAAAADIIVLNGQGITNLPWLFHLADRTHVILKQNLALALASVAVATLPTVAGMFPLWLAVTLHEGSTLLVALNSLRLLLEAPSSSNSSSSGGGSSKKAHSHGHGHDHRH